MEIQWFPGHMAKTRRLIDENLKQADVVIELLDARIPDSSKNPEIDGLISGKPRIVVLNKCDLADSAVTAQWEKYYTSIGTPAVLVDSVSGKGVSAVKRAAMSLMQEKLDKMKERGRIFKRVRTMVVGIPNVGKSSFINRVAGKSVAITGARPGVTRNKQWIRVDKNIELMDTPGILWPKFEDRNAGIRLALTGAIKDEIMDTSELALLLIEILVKHYPENYTDRYKIKTDISTLTPLEIMEETGKNRGCIISRGEVDYHRTGALVLDEFKNGRLGRISLEQP